MDDNIYITQITDIITPFIEDYLDDRYPEGAFDEMPNIDEVDDIAQELNNQLLLKYPELRQILSPNVGEGEAQVAYYGCGYILWAILVGSIFSRSNRNRRCCRRCTCGRNCRRGRGCRCC